MWRILTHMSDISGRVRRNIDHERRNGIPSAFSNTIVIRGETTEESRAIARGVGRMIAELIKGLCPFVSICGCSLVRNGICGSRSFKKEDGCTEEDIKPVETLITEAIFIIDMAVKVGSVHQNKGGHQKSPLSWANRMLLIQLGLYTLTSADI